MIKGALSGRPYAMGTGIGEAFGPATALGTGATGALVTGGISKYGKMAAEGTQMSPWQKAVYGGAQLIRYGSGGKFR